MEKMKIGDLREQLNRLIENGASFEEIQKVSMQLDECLVEYYQKQMGKE